MSTPSLVEAIRKSVITGSFAEIESQVEALVREGFSADEIIKQGLIYGMDEVARLWKEGQLFIPEVLMSAKTMHAAMNKLKGLLPASDTSIAEKVIIGTVQGDLHDIGKNLVRMMLESAGFQVIDLGVDVSPERFVEAVISEGARILAMSALLTTTMLAMGTVVKALADRGIRNSVKVIVGGACVTQEFADSIGADAYGSDANSAVDICRSFAFHTGGNG